MQAWTKAEAEKPGKLAKGERWVDAMSVPCRRCADSNGGVDVRKPLQTARAQSGSAAIWCSALANRQDMRCPKCRRAMRWETVKHGVLCDVCFEAI